MLAQLKADYPDDLRVIYRHFPLDGHDKAKLTTQAAEAAGLQGKFWEMHDLLYEKQGSWAGLSPDEFGVWIIDQAEILELDTEVFAEDMYSDEMVDLADEAFQFGVENGIPGTPFLLLDGQALPTEYYGYDQLSALFEYFLIPMGRMRDKRKI